MSSHRLAENIGKQTILEERLEEEIKLKELQITEASEDATDTERSDIGKELHDNVNQLLGASKLYLDMAKRGGPHMELNQGKISFTMENFNERDVQDKFKLNIFRIIQEHLNNILKHAKATIASISLLQNKGSIRLIITDNGVGFNTNKKRTGIGMANIISRATAYNGNADFVSQPGKGCVLTIIFPLTNALLNKSL